jgi:hypothetical protein
MPPTGKTGHVHGLEVVRFKDGKLAETWGYGSGLEFASSFGLIKEQPAKPATPVSKGPEPKTPPKAEPPKAEAKADPKAGQTTPAKSPPKAEAPPAMKK